jgi:protein-disulfide isomerase
LVRLGGRARRRWLSACLLAAAALTLAAGCQDGPGTTVATSHQDLAIPTVTDTVVGSVISGRPEAPVLLEEYADFQCPVCQRFHKTMDATIERLVAAGVLRFVFHPVNYLDAAGSTESLRSAAASLCASNAGRFWPYHDLLYDLQSPSEDSGYLTDDRLIQFGSDAGITMPASAAFESCVRNHTYQAAVGSDLASALALGLDGHGTPMLYLNGQLLGLTGYVAHDGVHFDPSRLTVTIRRATKGTPATKSEGVQPGATCAGRSQVTQVCAGQ